MFRFYKFYKADDFGDTVVFFIFSRRLGGGVGDVF